MFLNLRNKIASKVSIKLTVIYSLMLFFSSIILLSALYFFINGTALDILKKSAHAEMDTLLAEVQSRGIRALIGPNPTITVNSNLTVFYSDTNGEPTWEHVPSNSKLDFSSFRAPMESREADYEHVVIESSRESAIIIGRRTANGEYLMIGYNINNFGQFMSSIRIFCLILLVPMALMGLMGGAILSARMMSPIRELTTVIKKVQSGSLSTRVPASSGKDELNELKLTINKMLDKIEGLIGSLREAFDHLAHDIRTPVTRLRGRAEIALTSDGDLDSYREALESCFENSDKIVSFLQLLSDITEAENKSRKLRLEKTYLSDLVREVMELYEMAFEEKNIQFTAKMDKNDWAFVDRKLTSRVIANLLDNAHKYTPEGGSVTVEVENHTEYVKVMVKDSGPGIAPEEQNLVFQKLYRSDKSRSEYGMGLGLTFVKAVVEAHEGKVAIQSPVAEGRGTSFEVTLQKMS